MSTATTTEVPVRVSAPPGTPEYDRKVTYPALKTMVGAKVEPVENPNIPEAVDPVPDFKAEPLREETSWQTKAADAAEEFKAHVPKFNDQEDTSRVVEDNRGLVEKMKKRLQDKNPNTRVDLN